MQPINNSLVNYDRLPRIKGSIDVLVTNTLNSLFTSEALDEDMKAFEDLLAKLEESHLDIDVLGKIDFERTIDGGKFDGETLFYLACGIGCQNVVKLLIDKGVNITLPLKNGASMGMTPIFIATASGHLEAVKLLIEKHVDLQAPLLSGQYKGHTLITIASMKGRLDIVKLLIEKKVDYISPLKSGDDEGLNPISLAAMWGYPEIIELFIQNKVDFKAPLLSGYAEGSTLIFIGATYGHDDVVDLLIKKNVDFTSPMKSREMEGITPIFMAAASGHVDVVILLIKNNVDFQSPLKSGEMEGITPIFMAAGNGHVDVVDLLIKNKVDFTSPLKFGRQKGSTPLFRATSSGVLEIVELLIKNKADYTSPLVFGSCEGSTPLFVAAFYGWVKLVDLLIEYKVDLDAPLLTGTFKGNTPIFISSAEGRIEVVNTLIKNNVDYKSPLQLGKDKGCTPLMSAAKGGHTATVRLLLENNADFTSPMLCGQYQGLRPIELAAMKGHSNLVKLLIENDSVLPMKRKSITSVEVSDIVIRELKRMELTVNMIKKNIGTDISFQFFMKDGLFYLSFSHPSTGVKNAFRLLLERNNLRTQECKKTILASTTMLKMRSKTISVGWCIKKSDTNKLLKLGDDWKIVSGQYIETFEHLTNIFGNEIIDSWTNTDKGILLNLSPSSLAIFKSILQNLNASSQEDGQVLIPFMDLMLRKDINFDALAELAKMNAKRMTKIVNLARRYGKVKTEYTKTDLCLHFQNGEELRSFAKFFPRSKVSEEQLLIFCPYKDIYELDDNAWDEITEILRVVPVANSQANIKASVGSFQRALECFVSNYNKWTVLDDNVEVELHHQNLASLKPLEIDGLKLDHSCAKLTMSLDKLCELDDSDFKAIAELAKENSGRIMSFDAVVVRKVWKKDEKERFCEKGIAFSFKNIECEQSFRKNFSDMIEVCAENDKMVCIAYCKILELHEDQLASIVEAIAPFDEPNKVAQVVQNVLPQGNDAPLQRKPVRNVRRNTNVPVVKRTLTNKVKSVQKPARVGPSIPAQPMQSGAMPAAEKMSKQAIAGLAKKSLNANAEQGDLAPRPESVVVTKKPKGTLTDPEASIKHELQFMKGLCNWFRDFDPQSQVENSKAFCDNLWLGLMRYYNAVYLRAQKGGPNFVHLTSNDLDAKKMREFLIHYHDDSKSLTEHFERYILKSACTVIENNFKDSDDRNIESLANCLLLQLPSKRTDYPEMIKSQFKSISDYLVILETKANKQQKYLPDAFKCAFEGKMRDDKFCFLVHDATAIEACLVRLGELYKHIKNDTLINSDFVNFMRKCRILRNRDSHEVGSEANGYKTISSQTVKNLAEEARKLFQKGTF